MLQGFVVLGDHLLVGQWLLAPDHLLQECVDEVLGTLELSGQAVQVREVAVVAVNSESGLEPDVLVALAILEVVVTEAPQSCGGEVSNVLDQQTSDLIHELPCLEGMEQRVGNAFSHFFAGCYLEQDRRPATVQCFGGLLHDHQLEDSKSFAHVEVFWVDGLFAQDLQCVFGVQCLVKLLPTLARSDRDRGRPLDPEPLHNLCGLVSEPGWVLGAQLIVQLDVGCLLC